MNYSFKFYFSMSLSSKLLVKTYFQLLFKSLSELMKVDIVIYLSKLSRSSFKNIIESNGVSNLSIYDLLVNIY